MVADKGNKKPISWVQHKETENLCHKQNERDVTQLRSLFRTSWVPPGRIASDEIRLGDQGN